MLEGNSKLNDLTDEMIVIQRRSLSKFTSLFDEFSDLVYELPVALGLAFGQSEKSSEVDGHLQR